MLILKGIYWKQVVYGAGISKTKKALIDEASMSIHAISPWKLRKHPESSLGA
jgi:hypothetical protein